MEWWEQFKADREAARLKKEEEDKNKNNPPKEIMDKLAKVDAVESKVDTILKGLEGINAFADEYKKDKEARTAAETEAARKKAVKTPEQQVEEAEALAAALIDDPAGTVNKLTAGTQAAILELRADSIRKEVFEDLAEFPYYTGDIKTEIDKTIAAQTLQFRCNAESLKNAYYSVVGRKQKEISEGKVKSRFASSSSSLNNNSNPENKNEIKIEMSDEIRKAARNTGIAPEEYIKLLEKEAKDGNIAYV